MTDYSQYQAPSPEWDTLTATTEIPQFDPNLTPHQLRFATNSLRVKSSRSDWAESGLDDKVTYRDYSIETRDSQSIITRIYRPKSAPIDRLLPVYLFFHGGGHLFGSVESEDANCGRLVAATASTPGHEGIIVVHVNYRHTPEFTHPTQVNDAWDSFEWLAANSHTLGFDPNHVIVGGSSAGAGLAAWVVFHAHQLSRSPSSTAQVPSLAIKGQILAIPWLIHPDNHPGILPGTIGPSSYEQNMSNAPMLPREILRLFTDLLAAPDPTVRCLNIALALDEELRGLPKTSFIIAGQDLLRDEGLYYAKRLTGNGCVHSIIHFLSLIFSPLI
jgi:acetyl esterase/lipase